MTLSSPPILDPWPTPWRTHYHHQCGWEAVPEPLCVHDLFLRSARRTPDKMFLDFLGHGYSFAETAALVHRAARGFQYLGVRPGVRVGLFLPNCPHYVIAYYGILLAGGTVVNFSPLYSVDELIDQVEDSQTDIMVCLDVATLYNSIHQVLDASRLRTLIIGSLAEALPPGKALLYRMFRRREQAKITADIRHLRFEALLENDGNPKPVALDPTTAIALLQYTGGTTGTPKGAILTHASVAINAQQVVAIGRDIDLSGDSILGALPFFHVFANTCILNFAACIGARIAMIPKFELDLALKTIVRTRCTILPGVPTMYTALLAHPRLDRFDLSSVRLCISGGAPLPEELKKRFEARTGAVVVEGYGLTESSGVVAVNPYAGPGKSGSIGQPLPGTTVVIVDKEDPQRLLPLGEAGEITVAGPQMLQGYWNRPDSDQTDFIDGRFRTGDIGYLDAEGYIFIIDRMKDMIMVGGFKVFPRMVEEKLYTHPAIQEAMVIGLPDPYAGERPHAYVTLKPGLTTPPDAATLLTYIQAEVAKHERPATLEIRDSLPKTMIGKLSKKDLRTQEMAKRTASAL